MRPLVLLSSALLGVAACGADNIMVTRARDSSITIARGSQLTIVLQTIGPGHYATPAVSSPVVQFLSETSAGVAVPSGPTQEFHFQAVNAGRAVVVFQHTGSNPSVTDTIVVR
jgi:hypothetical protein